MKIEEIKQLIEILENSSLCELKYETDDIKIKLKKPTPHYHPIMANPTIGMEQPTLGNNSSTSNIDNIPDEKIEEELGTWVTAPFVGVFYVAASQNSAPFVKIGDTVKKGDTLCILEAMKVMNEIKSPIDGTIKAIKIENGNMVEYDEEMILIGD